MRFTILATVDALCVQIGIVRKTHLIRAFLLDTTKPSFESNGSCEDGVWVLECLAQKEDDVGEAVMLGVRKEMNYNAPQIGR